MITLIENNMLLYSLKKCFYVCSVTYSLWLLEVDKVDILILRMKQLVLDTALVSLVPNFVDIF